MGVGKTTVGSLLAVELGRPFLDSDEYLEANFGESGEEIAAREGVERLHEIELEVFLLMCDNPVPSVIAPAASVVDHQSGREALEENFTVWLTAPDDVLAERHGRSEHRRPVSADERAMLRASRAPLLQGVSAITVDTSSSLPPQIVEELIGLLPESLPAGESG